MIQSYTCKFNFMKHYRDLSEGGNPHTCSCNVKSCLAGRCLVKSRFLKHCLRQDVQIFPTLCDFSPLIVANDLKAPRSSASPQVRTTTNIRSISSIFHSLWKGLLHFFLNFGILVHRYSLQTLTVLVTVDNKTFPPKFAVKRRNPSCE